MEIIGYIAIVFIVPMVVITASFATSIVMDKYDEVKKRFKK